MNSGIQKSRRNFLAFTSALFVAGNFINPKRLKANDESDRSMENFPELELVGKVQPPLFGEGFNLRKKAADAFNAMRETTRKDGIEMYSVSSYRGYERQKGIWDRKYKDGLKQKKSASQIVLDIISYSTIPGTSRHHWGTDLDIVDIHPSITQPPDPLHEKHFAPGGVYHPLYQWMKKHANTFGFYEVYTNSPGRTGFSYEPWHWSFAEISKPMLKQYCEMDWQAHVAAKDLIGREALTPDFLQRYYKEWILGINPNLIAEGI